MKIIRHILAPFLLAIWMLVSFGIFEVIYIGIEWMVGYDEFYDLERTLGGVDFQLANRAMEYLWFPVLVSIPILILMAIPAVWLIRRYR